MVQTVGVKLVNLVGQVILARILLKEEFGLFGLAMVILTFANLIQDAGLQQILIHRQAHFHRWATPAFWLSLVIGLLGGVAMALAAPLAAYVWHAPQLTGMILILALRSPLNAFSTVPMAWLQSQLRFRLVMLVGLIEAAITMSLSVVFARYGFGAYAFVAPLPIAAVFRGIILWRMAMPPLKLSIQVRRWKYLVADSGILLVSLFFFTLSGQGDYIILGRRFNHDVIGVYFFAFQLTLQTTQFFTVNLARVLFPTLTKLQHDPDRQRRAFYRATNLLMLFGVPVCLIQAALAGPVVRILFGMRWVPSIPVLQVISIAMSLQLVNMPALGMIQAQGRFKTLLGLSIFCAFSFVGMVTLGSIFGTPPGGEIRFAKVAGDLAWFFKRPIDVATVVAMAVTVHCAVIGPLCLYLAVRPVGGKLRDLQAIYLLPLGMSVLAIGVAAAFGHLIPDMPGQDWLRIIVITALTVVLYLPMVRWSSRSAWDDLLARIRGLIKPTPPANGADAPPAPHNGNPA